MRRKARLRALTKIKKCIDKEMIATDYELVEQIVLDNVGLGLPDDTNDDEFTPLEYEKMINLVYGFFKAIDKEYYEQAVTILKGNTNVRIYNRNNIDPDEEPYSSLRDSDNIPLFEEASVLQFNNIHRMYLPYTCSIFDVYVYTHEIAHTLGVCGYNVANNMFAEVIPLIFEKKVNDYLIENGYEEDVIKYKAKINEYLIRSAFDIGPLINVVNILTKNQKLNYDKIKEETIKKSILCKHLNICDINYDNYFKKTIGHLQNFDVYEINDSILFILGEAISTNYYLNYFDQNNLDKCIKAFGKVDMYLSLDYLGLKVNNKGKCLNKEEITASLSSYYHEEKTPVKKLVKQ